MQDELFRHRVNTWRALRAFLDGPADIAEGDVLIGHHGPAGPMTAIMAHPPETGSDLSFDEWATALHESGRGIKVDLKDPAVLDTVVETLTALRFRETRLILNADVCVGPGNIPPRLEIDHLAQLRTAFPRATISVGATTRPDRGPYTPAHVDRLRTAATRMGEPVTVALRVGLVLADPTVLEGLGDIHITFWNAAGSPADANVVRKLRALRDDAFLDLISADEA